jgi:hypothetical protein
VNPPALARRLDGRAGGVDIFRYAARETGDRGAFDLPGDGLDGGEIAFADDWETRLDDIDFEAGQLAGDFDFFS